MHIMKPGPIMFFSLLLLVPAAAQADTRSAAQRAAFVQQQPCPATGKSRGVCPGYQVDHVAPLCANGADHPENMQWLTIEQHRVKTRFDRRICRALRRGILVED